MHLLIFEKVLSINEIDFANKLLLKYYLGSEIDLNRNVKDHGSDLEILLSDYLEIIGQKRLELLFNDPGLSKKNVNNIWVLNALIDFFGEDKIPEWLPVENEIINITNEDINWLLLQITNGNRSAVTKWAIRVKPYLDNDDATFGSHEIQRLIKKNHVFLINCHLKTDSGNYLYSHDFLLDKLNI